MKRLPILLILFLLPFLASAQHSTGLKVLSYKITSAWPASLRSVKGRAKVVVNNTDKERTLSDIKALVYRNGEPFVEGVCTDVALERGQVVYTPQGLVTLCEGQSVWDAIKAALAFDASEYTVDISMQVAYSDTTAFITRKGVPLKKYLK